MARTRPAERGVHPFCVATLGEFSAPWSPWGGGRHGRLLAPGGPEQPPKPSGPRAVYRLSGCDPFAHGDLAAWVAWAREDATSIVELEGPGHALAEPANLARVVALRPDRLRIELASASDERLEEWLGAGALATRALDGIAAARAAGLSVVVVMPLNRTTAGELESLVLTVDARFRGEVPIVLSRRPLRVPGPGRLAFEETDWSELEALGRGLAALPMPLPHGAATWVDEASGYAACQFPAAAWRPELLPVRHDPVLGQRPPPTPECEPCAWKRHCAFHTRAPAPLVRPLAEADALRLQEGSGDARTTAQPGAFRRTDPKPLALPDLLCFAPFTTFSISELQHRPVPCAQAWVDTTMTPEHEAAVLGMPLAELRELNRRSNASDAHSNWHEVQNEEWPLREVWNSPLLRHMRRQMAHGGPSDRCRSSCRVILGVEERGVQFFTVPDEDLTPEVVANRRLLREEILEKRDRLTALPLEVNCGVSANCNIDCGFCHGPRGTYGELTDRRREELQELLPTMMSLSIVGPGEPLMSPAFGKLLEHISARGYPSLQLSLVTNGTLITRRWLEKLPNLRWGHIRVSLNAGTAASWERMTGKDLFDRIVANLEAIAELRARTTPPFTFTLSCVLNNNVLEHPEELNHFARLADRLKANVALEPVTGDALSPFEHEAKMARLAAACASVASEFKVRNPPISRAFAAMSGFTSERLERKLFQLLPRR
jgi:molybdenum cofactor biosynthesis enzyme MoaA